LGEPGPLDEKPRGSLPRRTNPKIWGWAAGRETKRYELTDDSGMFLVVIGMSTSVARSPAGNDSAGSVILFTGV
jgi:hypothetical protein